MPTTSVLKPFARSYAIQKVFKPGIKYPHAASQSYSPGAMPAAYNMPNGIEVTPVSIAILQLGGQFYPGDLDLWAQASGLPKPMVRLAALPGADNSSGPADAEKALDWQKAAEWYSSITGLSATIEQVTGPNSDTGIPDVMTFCNALPNVGAGSISWGQGEDLWSPGSLVATRAASLAAPFPWCAASGDNGSNDGEAGPTLDAPSSIASIVSCGGTSRVPGGGSETVWNNGNGEGTGGGFSKIEDIPPWQSSNAQDPAAPPTRMSPDIAMNADPNTGHNVIVQGQTQVIGGTSAVAPMFAGFLAAVNGRRLFLGKPMIAQANPLLWAAQSSFYDVISGNNGAYNATTGPDPCSGLGRPLATLFFALTGESSLPPPPPAFRLFEGKLPLGFSTYPDLPTAELAAHVAADRDQVAVTIQDATGAVVETIQPVAPLPPTPTGLTLPEVLALLDGGFATLEAHFPPAVAHYLKRTNKYLDALLTKAWSGASSAGVPVVVNGRELNRLLQEWNAVMNRDRFRLPISDDEVSRAAFHKRMGDALAWSNANTGTAVALPPFVLALLQLLCKLAPMLPAPYSAIATGLCLLLPKTARIGEP